jgi:hypothetical protein
MLTEDQVARAKAHLKHYKLTDSGGLYLFVYSSGGKAWRYDYVLDGRKETVGLGQYPDLSLARARELHAEARALVARGESPARAKARIRRAEREAARKARETRTREWASRFEPNTQIAAFAEKKLSEITASEGIVFVNALAGVFADVLAERVASRLEKSQAPSGGRRNERKRGGRPALIKRGRKYTTSTPISYHGLHLGRPNTLPKLRGNRAARRPRSRATSSALGMCFLRPIF